MAAEAADRLGALEAGEAGERRALEAGEAADRLGALEAGKAGERRRALEAGRSPARSAALSAADIPDIPDIDRDRGRIDQRPTPQGSRVLD